MAKSGDSGRENTINGRRDSGQSNGNKQGNVKYSLSKDSQGNALSENQEKFFKDSKIRDGKGNLLVVYHGTDADSDIVEWALYKDRTLAQQLRDKGYDWLMLEDMRQIVALYPNQIKNKTNNFICWFFNGNI